MGISDFFKKSASDMMSSWPASKVLEHLVNRQFSDIGTIEKLKLQLDAKQGKFDVLLNGETRSFSVDFTFDVMTRDTASFLIVKSFKSSRPWLDAIYSWFPEPKELELPDHPAIEIVKKLIK